MNRTPLPALIWLALGLALFVAVTHAQAPAAGQAPAGAQAPATPPPPGGGRGFTPGTESGFATFQTRCTGCHGNPAVERAPSPNAIREMTPERIYESLTTGSMQTQSKDLNDAQKKAL
ncbi:MAG TPA: cytochrome c, partial [Vicinamibacterales bacterium]|nr:cytochrome c [Vicinamibacterales bacterium]